MGSECSFESPGTHQASEGGLPAASDVRANGAMSTTWSQTGPSLNPPSISQWTTLGSPV